MWSATKADASRTEAGEPAVMRVSMSATVTRLTTPVAPDVFCNGTCVCYSCVDSTLFWPLC